VPPTQILASSPAETPADLLTLTVKDEDALTPQALLAVTLNILLPLLTLVVALTVIAFVPLPDTIVHPEGTVQL